MRDRAQANLPFPAASQRRRSHWIQAITFQEDPSHIPSGPLVFAVGSYNLDSKSHEKKVWWELTR